MRVRFPLLVVGAAVASGCGGFIEAPGQAEEPPPADARAGEPRDGQSGEAPTPAAPPGPPAVGVGRHAPLACGAKLPATGRFHVDEPLLVPITPVDVYATEREYDGVRTLEIAFTETAQECAYQGAAITPRNRNELRLAVRRRGEIGPGTYRPGGPDDGVVVEHESGERCVTNEELATTGGWGGTAYSARQDASNVVTVTRRTPTLVEGTFDVTTGDGQRSTGTFSAPFCGKAPSAPGATCCPR